MSRPLAAKIPHPVQSRETAERNRRAICDARGYCGPFINITYYGQYPDTNWHGVGECIVCCSTCRVEVEQEKRAAACSAAAAPIEARQLTDASAAG